MVAIELHQGGTLVVREQLENGIQVGSGRQFVRFQAARFFVHELWMLDDRHAPAVSLLSARRPITRPGGPATDHGSVIPPGRVPWSGSAGRMSAALFGPERRPYFYQDSVLTVKARMEGHRRYLRVSKIKAGRGSARVQEPSRSCLRRRSVVVGVGPRWEGTRSSSSRIRYPGRSRSSKMKAISQQSPRMKGPLQGAVYPPCRWSGKFTACGRGAGPAAGSYRPPRTAAPGP